MSSNCRFAMATHIMAILALKADGPTTSEFMAGSINTNPVVVRRLIAALGRAGLVHAQRGAAGGVTLAKQPDRIRLWDIHEAVEANDSFAVHQHPNDACPVGRKIQRVLAQVRSRTEQALKAELSHITVADIVGEIGARAATG
ncbi:MAG: Rrf2 family transcriptional regulator [Proteobacteria bacterium]|nr:Rrf2 family transcriptional regulator [Pseudomonadota bacterium]MBI3497882.1 Rrf2 family transcriptional regulator [Pseudomonadota bacterium]